MDHNQRSNERRKAFLLSQVLRKRGEACACHHFLCVGCILARALRPGGGKLGRSVVIMAHQYIGRATN